MTLTSNNLVAWHDATSAQHVAKRDSYAAKGFRPLSISVYGTPSSPRYAAVMVKRPQVIATHSFIDQSFDEFQKTFDAQAKNGFGPFLLSATGSQGNAVYASSFRKMSSIPLTRHDLSKQDFIELNKEQKDAGRILIWADAFGTASNTRYCAIWAANPGRVAWNIDAVDEAVADLQQRFEAICGGGGRPSLIAVTPAGRYLEMFDDTDIGPWESRVDMTSSSYQAHFDAKAKKGLWPIRVSASGTGSGARFGAIWAGREETDARQFTATGGTGVSTIDNAIKTYMQAHNLRGVALAIGHGTRLLYARGYTWAEPAYPDIQPQTLFRQASVSKAYCAIAVWKLIEQGKLARDTTLQSVLSLTQADGSAPKDSRFADITIDHLLGSRSGIDQGGVWHAIDANAAFGGALPSTGLEVARWICAQDLTGTPGNTMNSVYGNTDYFLLSLVVMKIAKASSFESALKSLVLDPLKMAHTRGSRTLPGDQLSGEARHHLTVHNPENGWALHQFNCGRSVRDNARPIVLENYGTYDYEMFDGCGGLSASVVDVARLCAMLSCRTGNPVLKAETIDEIFAATIACGSQTGPDGNGSHGYHGFDWASTVSAADHQVQYSKGGWLPGQGSVMTGTTNGFFYVIAQNGNGDRGVSAKWLPAIEPIVEAQDWGSADLFPAYGMPSLGLSGLKIKKLPSLKAAVAKADLVEGSMAASMRMASVKRLRVANRQSTKPRLRQRVRQDEPA